MPKIVGKDMILWSQKIGGGGLFFSCMCVIFLRAKPAKNKYYYFNMKGTL